MGGGQEKVVEIVGTWSVGIKTIKSQPQSMFVRSKLNRIDEACHICWKAKGAKDAVTVDRILEDVKKDGCLDVFLKKLVIIKPYIVWNDYYMENQEITIEFVFEDFPIGKRKIWEKLKTKMPSSEIWKKIQELKERYRQELDKETKKRFRGIFLINRPPKALTNEDIWNIWHGKHYVLILKEKQGKFEVLELEEFKGA